MTARVRSWRRWSISYGALPSDFRNGYDEGYRVGVSRVLFWYAIVWLALILWRTS